MAVAALGLLLGTGVLLNLSRLGPESGPALTKEYLAAFDRAAAAIPSQSVLVLERSSFSQKAQLSLRTRHGHWSFVAWNDKLATEAIERLSRTGRRTYVELELAERHQIPYDPAERHVIPVILSPSERGSVTLVRVSPRAG